MEGDVVADSDAGTADRETVDVGDGAASTHNMKETRVVFGGAGSSTCASCRELAQQPTHFVRLTHRSCLRAKMTVPLAAVSLMRMLTLNNRGGHYKTENVPEAYKRTARCDTHAALECTRQAEAP